MRVRDGTRLVADIYRPSDKGPWPALLMRTPYDRCKAETLLYAHPAWYASQGFAVVIQDVRGRFESGGDFDPWVHEGEDGVDTIDWIATQSWCNGRIGMYGFSYPGLVQLLAGGEGHPALRAVAPGLAPLRLGEGWLFNGGAFAIGFALGWALDLVGDTARRRAPDRLPGIVRAWRQRGEEYAFRPLRDHPLATASSLAPYYREWLDQERSPAYWEARTVEPSTVHAQPAALYIGAWYDPFIASTIDAYRCATESGSANPASLLIGPWHHYPNMSSAFPARPDNPRVIDDLQVAWFDQFLLDRSPRLDRARLYRTGADRWETPDDSSLRAVARRLYLRSDGRANSVFGSGALAESVPPASETPDRYVYDPVNPIVAPDANPSGYPLLTPQGRANQREVEVSNSVLIYTSAALERSLRVAGAPSVRLHAQSTAIDTDWVATLCEVTPDGHSYNLCRGIVRARFANEWASIRDNLLTYDILLPPIYHEFQAGYHVRLQVTSSSFPVWEPNPNTGNPLGSDRTGDVVVATQTVVHEADHPSYLELPCET